MGKETISRGALIVFEGCDRCGKTTQCAKLKEKLINEGQDVELIKFPDRTTPIGKLINSYLQMTEELDDRVAHLLFSSNRWEAMELMKKKLKSGTTLIVDRYAYSGIAYSSAKGMDLDWCKNPDVGLIQPDKVIYLSVSEEVASQRSQYGGERYEKLDFQKKVHKNFLALQEKYWEVVAGDASVDDIHNQIYNIVRETIQQSRSNQLSKLWTDGEF